MKRLLPLCMVAGCSGSPKLGSSSSPVVIDRDDRRDVYEHEDAWLRDLARQSVVAQVTLSALDFSDPSDVHGATAPTGLCPGVRFHDDPWYATCSGTLIDDDLVLTAGHCVDSIACPGTGYMFNYLHDQPGIVGKMTSDDIYSCKSVLLRKKDSPDNPQLDYAIVQLDRKATPRHRPAPVHAPTRPSLAGHAIGMIGAPSGMPLKIDSGGIVSFDVAPWPNVYFEITADAFHGNSGGPLFDLTDYTQVGVLTGSGGESDYVIHDMGGVTCSTPAVYSHATVVGCFVESELRDFCAGIGAGNARLCGGSPRNDTPASAEEVAFTAGRAQVLSGWTTLAAPTMNPSCALSGPDVFYRFTLAQTSIVYADSFSSDFDTVLFLTHDTDHQTSGYACSDDACTSYQSQLSQVLPPGTYYLGVGGWNGSSGHYNVHVQALAAGAESTNLSATPISGNTAGHSNSVSPVCAYSSAPDTTYYSLTCAGAPTAENLQFSTCGGATWDTVLEYRSGNSTTQACVDDTWPCGRQSSFYATAASGAGIRAVTVDGYAGDSGAFSLSYSLPNIQVHPDVSYATPLEGPGGGTAFTVACPTGTIMTGLHTIAYGTGVFKLGPICQSVRSDGSLYGAVEVTPVGSSDPGLDFVDRCPLGQFVVGLRTRPALDVLGVMCAPQYPWLKSGELGTQLRLEGPYGASASITDLCYSGLAVNTLSGQWHSGGITQISANCVGVY